MGICKENIKKLKELCESLDDRDKQLKINAKTLWVILERVEAIKGQVLKISPENKEASEELARIAKELDGVSAIVVDRGCKPASGESHE